MTTLHRVISDAAPASNIKNRCVKNIAILDSAGTVSMGHDQGRVTASFSCEVADDPVSSGPETPAVSLVYEPLQLCFCFELAAKC